jgi:hypothetical protein
MNTNITQSGYTHCACRDCMDPTGSTDTTTYVLCAECEDAGCEAHDASRGHGYTCQRADALVRRAKRVHREERAARPWWRKAIDALREW